MAYWRLYYHLVWATHQRLPLIDAESERIVCGTLHSKAKDLGVFIHEIGMVTDHVHVVASIAPTITIADTVSQLKGASSHAVNHLAERSGARFRWQDGYAVLSIGERSLPTVATYVRNQKQHHADGSTNRLLERTNEDRPERPKRR